MACRHEVIIIIIPYSGVLCLHSLPSLWLSDICYCVLCHAYNVFVCLDDGSHCEGEKASLAQPLSRVHHMLWVEASSTTLKWCGRSPKNTTSMKSSHKWNEKPSSVLFVWRSLGSDSFSSEKRCHPMLDLSQEIKTTRWTSCWRQYARRDECEGERRLSIPDFSPNSRSEHKIRPFYHVLLHFFDSFRFDLSDFDTNFSDLGKKRPVSDCKYDMLCSGLLVG